MTTKLNQNAVEQLIEHLNQKFPTQMRLISQDNQYLLEHVIAVARETEKQEKQNYLKAYFEWHKSMGFVSHKSEDIIEFNQTCGGNK
jgi:hypothetical protein